MLLCIVSYTQIFVINVKDYKKEIVSLDYHLFKLCQSLSPISSRYAHWYMV